MELKKKFKRPTKSESNMSSSTDQDSVDMTTMPTTGLPPRKIKHHTSLKETTPKPKKGLGVAIAISCIFLFVFGIWFSTGKNKEALNKQEGLNGIGQIPNTASSQPHEQIQETPKEHPSESTSSAVNAPKEEQPPVEVAAVPPKDPPIETKSNTSADDNSKQAEQHVVRLVIKPGDTLYRISVRYYHTGRYTDYLAKYNHLKNPTDMVVGKTIEVPYPPTE